MGVIALLTALFAARALRVRFDNSIESLLPEGHPAVLQDRIIKEVFESREMILIGVLREDGVFHPGTLAKVAELSRAMWSIDLIEDDDVERLARWVDRVPRPIADALSEILRDGLDASDRGAVTSLWVQVRDEAGLRPFATVLEEIRLRLAPVGDVLSLSEIDDITSSEFGLEVAPVMARAPEAAIDIADLAARVFGNEMFVGGLVAADSSGTLILVEMAFHYDDHLDLARALFERIEELTRRFSGPEELRLGGVPMVNVYTSNFMNGDLARLLPLALLALLITLYGAFRWAPGVFIPLAVVMIALVWTLGLMELLGRPVTLVVSAMPVILIAIGVADGVHVVGHYRKRVLLTADKGGAIVDTMDDLAAPIVFTSLTDMAGFGSLAVSSLASIRDFGLFTAFGAFAALVVSLTFVPAALAVLPVPPSTTTATRSPDRLASILGRWAEHAARRRGPIVIATVAGVIVASLALPRIRVGSTMLGYFKETSEIYRSSEMINARFGGTEVLNIVVDTGTPEGLKDPATLTLIAALQDTLEARQLVGYTASLADYVKRIHRVMNGGDPSFSRIPRSTERLPGMDRSDLATEHGGRELIAQYLLLYESAGGEDLRQLVDLEYRTANIIAQIRTDQTPLLREIRDVATSFAEREFDGNIHVTFAGCSNLCIVADDLIIPGQLRSLALAVSLVLVLLIVVLGSVRLGLVALLPLLLTVLGVFALLGATGVSLDAVTALIASIVLGVGIDYSVHLLARYRRLVASGLDTEAAIQRAVTETGPPIVVNSIAVAIGFLVLLSSSFWPIVHIGWIVAVTMILAAALTLTLLPALLSREGSRPFAPGLEEPR